MKDKIIYSDLRKRYEYILSLSFALVALFQFNYVFVEQYFLYLKYSIIVLLLLLVIFYISRYEISTPKIIVAFSYIIFLLVIAIYSGDRNYLGVMLITYLCLFLVQKQVVVRSANLFIDVYCIILFLGMVLYLFILLFDIHHTSTLFSTNPLKIEQGVFFKNYYGLLNMTSYEGVELPLYRFQSIFDEPGVVGTISGISLFCVFDSKNKFPQKIILIASGLLSLSTAFLIYSLLIFLINRGGDKKTILYFALICLTILFILMFVDENIFTLIKSMLQHKLMEGDNRVDGCFQDAFSRNFNNSMILGHGWEKAQSLGCNVSSYLIIIYDIGLFGGGVLILLNLISLVALSSSCFPKRVKVTRIFSYFIIIMLTLYQRVYVINLALTILGVLYINNSTNKSSFLKEKLSLSS